MAPIEAPVLARLEPASLAAALGLSVEAGWNQTIEDWSLFFALGEVYGICDGDVLVASAAILPYGGSFAWVSMVLTRQAHRGRGHGTTLLRHCLKRLDEMGRTALLDATPKGEPLYRSLGFEPMFSLTRWQGEGAGIAAGHAAGLADEQLAAAIALDRRAFGADRSALLQTFAGRRPGLTRSASGAEGALFGRDGRLAMQIGPVVATDDAQGVALVEAALDQIGGPVFVDAVDEGPLAPLLERRGFTAQRPFLRMKRGTAAPAGGVIRTMAIAGPEFG